jgi:hypothetical protein
MPAMAKWCFLATMLGLVGCNGFKSPPSESEAELRAQLEAHKRELSAQGERLTQLEARVSMAEAANVVRAEEPTPTEPQRLWIPWSIRLQYHGTRMLSSWGGPQPLDALPSREACLSTALNYVRSNTGDASADSTVFRYGEYTYEVRCLPEGTKPDR